MDPERVVEREKLAAMMKLANLDEIDMDKPEVPELFDNSTNVSDNKEVKDEKNSTNVGDNKQTEDL